MCCRFLLRPVLVLLLFAMVAPTVYAETKAVTAESTYIMGDGETPTFAEEMVLRKAKQLALEQAGTYVEIYVKVHNLDLTVEEIQTITGGILEVEVLDQNRKLVGDSLQFFVKIKAVATMDKMEELARRVRGRDVVAEFKKLQADYVRLSEELETWKQIAGTNSVPAERTTAYSNILERQRALIVTWGSQDGLVHSLVSGQDMVVTADNEQEVLDELIRTMATQGHTIELGKGKVVRSDSAYRLIVPVTLKLKEEAFRAVTDVARRFHGIVWPKLEVETENSVRVGREDKTWSPISMMAVRASEDLMASASFQTAVDRLTLLLELRDSTGQAAYCLPRSLERWRAIRRVQPVSVLLRAKEKSKERVRAINELPRTADDRFDYELLAWAEMDRGYRIQARGPHGKVPRGYQPPHITTEKGYVALIRHEAKFRVAINLTADSARLLKQITAAIIAGDPHSLPPAADRVECTILPEE